MYPELIENIRNNTYVDNLVSGGDIYSEVEVIKQKSMELFAKGGYKLSGIQIYHYEKYQTVVIMMSLLMPNSYSQIIQAIPKF